MATEVTSVTSRSDGADADWEITITRSWRRNIDGNPDPLDLPQDVVDAIREWLDRRP